MNQAPGLHSYPLTWLLVPTNRGDCHKVRYRRSNFPLRHPLILRRQYVTALKKYPLSCRPDLRAPWPWASHTIFRPRFPPLLFSFPLPSFLQKLFNCSIVDLQCCVSFWSRAKGFNYIHTYRCFSYSFPLWFVTGYWTRSPIPYTRNLFICFIYSSLYLLLSDS